MSSALVLRAAARPTVVRSPPAPACSLWNWLQRQPLSPPSPPPAPQAVRAARPRQQAAARAPARALYFHSRQSVIAAAAEVGRPLACLAADAPGAAATARSRCPRWPPRLGPTRALSPPQAEAAAEEEEEVEELVEEEFEEEEEAVPSSVRQAGCCCLAP